MDKEIIKFNIPDLSVKIDGIFKMSSDKKYRDTHLHKEIEMIIVNEGQINCVMGDNELLLNKGDVVFINSNVAHRIEATDKEANCLFFFVDMENYYPEVMKGFEKYLYAFFNIKNAQKFAVFKNNENREIIAILNGINYEFINKKNSYKLYIRSYVIQLIAALRRYGILFDLDSMVGSAAFVKIMPVLEYIHSHYADKLDLEEISEIIGMNKFYFCRLFKKAMGTTFLEYVNFVRLNNAEHMLSRTDEAITDIGFSTGFSSVQYFNRVFKRYNGCTPKAYRRIRR